MKIIVLRKNMILQGNSFNRNVIDKNKNNENLKSNNSINTIKNNIINSNKNNKDYSISNL